MNIMNRILVTVFFVGILLPTMIFSQSDEVVTNRDVISMTTAGLSPDVIIAKIKSAKSSFDTSIEALQELKRENVAESVILIMMQSAPNRSRSGARLTDELTSGYNDLKNTVVTVWSEVGHGTGFIFDARGLIMTNQHVIGPSQYIAVQFDPLTKIPAVLLASNAENDVAILWVDISALPKAAVAKIAENGPNEPSIVEGERVFTIGSPLNQRKIITTGIASRIEERVIISDVNINGGNSGGPLFNSLGEVVGITTFADEKFGAGPGITGVVRIEQAVTLIDEARKKIVGVTIPSSKLLPVEPPDAFPVDVLKEVATTKTFKVDPYVVNIGDFDVTFFTPPLIYNMQFAVSREALKEREKRNKKDGSVKDSFRPFDDYFFGWQEYVGEYKPVLIIKARPEIGESFWSAFRRGFAAYYGYHAQQRLRFKTDFHRMRLFCGNTEVEPIHPGKNAYIKNTNNYYVSITDATYDGQYIYPADAVSPLCGRVRLEIYSEKEPNKPTVKEISFDTIRTINYDFLPYLERKSRGQLTPFRSDLKGLPAQTPSPKLGSEQNRAGVQTQPTPKLPATLPTGSGTESTSAVTFHSSPNGADIEIDGKFAGNTPSMLQLKVGDHKITIKSPGFAVWERTIAVGAGGTVNINANLQKAVAVVTQPVAIPVTLKPTPEPTSTPAATPIPGPQPNPETVSTITPSIPVTKTATPTSPKNATGIELVWIPAGSFQMGSTDGEKYEKPVRRVVISEGFWMGKYEVTQLQWFTEMGVNPSDFEKCGGACPVENVSWEDAQRFVAKLNAKNDGFVYSLPTEAQWEYAARGGTNGKWAGDVASMAWYKANSGGTTRPVGTKQPNAFGLYDMHGNLWEWCEDWSGDYSATPETDPKGPAKGKYRILRGGSWKDGENDLRSAKRAALAAKIKFKDMGFRVVARAR